MLSLLADGAIDGVSVLVQDDMDVESLEALLALRTTGKIAVGLHLNLTQNLPGYPALGGILAVWMKSILGRRQADRATDSLGRQLEAFIARVGRPPDFLDGHHHCHAIPGLWPVLRALHARLPANTWIRSPCPASLSGIGRELGNGGLKTLLVMSWGWQLRRRLKQAGIQTNRDFSGFMRYRSGDPGYLHRFRQMLELAGEDCLIMVHPGSDQAREVDHPPACRALETQVLKDLFSMGAQGASSPISR